MRLELVKLLVQPVVLERDQDGRIVGEHVGETTAVYTRDQVTLFLDTLDEQIMDANARQNGRPDG